MKKIHILFAHLIEVINSLYLHWLSFYPLAVLNIRTLCGNFSYVYLRIEVRCEWIAMIASVTVEDIYIVYFVKIMLLSICTENTCYTWVKARSEKRCDTSLFKSLSISPLPLIFKLCSVLRLIVCCVNIVYFTLKTSVHNVKILIRQSHVDTNIRLILFHKSHKLRHVVCVHLCSCDICLCLILKFLLEFIAL